MTRAPMAAVIVSALLVAVLLAVIWSMQRRFMYFPMDGVPSPGALGFPEVEPVTFPTIDGLDLSGWFFPAAGSPARAAVLVFNGNAGNRAYRAPLADALRRHRLQVLLFDYRGYGGNPGSPSENGLADDARAARAYLASRPDVDAARLVYFGESLGTAVAIGLAAQHPPAALILRSPFTSMADVGQHHYPFLPVGRFLRDRFAAVERIHRVGAPLLVIAGERDRIVPLDFSRRLYESATAPKTMVVVPGADHNDDELLAGDEMMGAILRFLEPIV